MAEVHHVRWQRLNHVIKHGTHDVSMAQWTETYTSQYVIHWQIKKNFDHLT